MRIETWMRSTSVFACSHGMPLNSREGRDGEGVRRNARTVASSKIVTFCNPCRNVINPVALCDYKTKKKSWHTLESIRQSIALCNKVSCRTFAKKFHTALYNKTFWLFFNFLGQHFVNFVLSKHECCLKVMTSSVT